ncbi:DUF3370 family protein [Chitinimonas sp. BJYL2]|uniref:DUF3370 family protein n=1 Tax=Chitinimonas sp. BJYL2 TaxID=2976696 RepID=UPI0022B3DE0E|nr:DUF3370 family protein [Chitinimonas sp. BJYL2]
MKKDHSPAWPARCITLALLGATAQASPLLVQSDTWFKTSTADSASLPAASKCLVTAGTRLEANGATSPASNHYQVTLSAAPAGCAFSSGYFYSAHVSWHNWLTGPLAVDTPVPKSELSAFNAGYGGYPIWKSNNPEKYSGTGWLMQNGRADAARGGSATPISGCTNAYTFHINNTGRTAYVHLMASNPNGSALTLNAKGSMYSNTEKPLTGKAAGQSYFVAKDWLNGTFRTNISNRSVNAYTATEIAKVTANVNNMIDGRFEVCTDRSVYLYTVVTYSGTTTDAINATQGAAAPGEIYSPGPGKFGREAGIYAASVVGGTSEVILPASGKYLGLAFNTTAKGAGLQEQTQPATMRLADSSERTYGNYGHKYDVTVRMRNNDSYAKTVRLSFASSFTGSTDTPSFTFNSPAKLNGTAIDLWTTPTKPRQTLGTWTIGANSYFDARLTTFIAGLGVTDQQLVVEVL